MVFSFDSTRGVISVVTSRRTALKQMRKLSQAFVPVETVLRLFCSLGGGGGLGGGGRRRGRAARLDLWHRMPRAPTFSIDGVSSCRHFNVVPSLPFPFPFPRVFPSLPPILCSITLNRWLFTIPGRYLRLNCKFDI